MKFKVYGDDAKEMKQDQTFQVLRKYTVEGRDVVELIEVD